MDKNIQKLLDIGLEEVSKKTYIEIDNLQEMVNENFDAFNKNSAVGFAKIIEREYKIDMSDWVQKMRNHKNEEDEQLQDASQDVRIEESKTQKENSAIWQNTKKNGNKKLIVGGVVVLSAIWLASSLFQSSQDSQNPQEDSIKTTTANTQTQTENQAQELEEETQSHKTSSISFGSRGEYGIDQPRGEEKIDDNLTNDENSTKIEDQNVQNTDENRSANNNLSGKIILSSNSSLWVGILYLDTFTKTQYTNSDSNITLDTSRPQIIKTGHGIVDIKTKNGLDSYKNNKPIRFYIKDDNMTELSFYEYKKFAKGKGW